MKANRFYLLGCLIVAVAVSLLTYGGKERAYAGGITQIVFTQTSTARSGLTRPSLRIKVCDSLRTDRVSNTVQALPLSLGSTYNYYLTKTLTFPVTDSMAMIEIQTDYDVTYTLNTETAGMVIQSGVPIIRALKK